jgi:hypothetical protein
MAKAKIATRKKGSKRSKASAKPARKAAAALLHVSEFGTMRKFNPPGPTTVVNFPVCYPAERTGQARPVLL